MLESPKAPAYRRRPIVSIGPQEYLRSVAEKRASQIDRLFGRLTLLAALVAVALLLGALLGGVFDDAELATVDTRFDLRGETAPPTELLIVAIDEETFGELREQWPFPRSLHAKVVDRIAADGPAAIVYDVQFTEETVPEEDNDLIDAVAAAGSVVLATTEVADDGSTGIFGGLPLSELGARAGSALFAPDPGGVVRKIAYEVEGLPTLAVAATETATGRGGGRACGRRGVDRLPRQAGLDPDDPVLAGRTASRGVLRRSDCRRRRHGLDPQGSAHDIALVG